MDGEGCADGVVCTGEKNREGACMGSATVGCPALAMGQQPGSRCAAHCVPLIWRGGVQSVKMGKPVQGGCLQAASVLRKALQKTGAACAFSDWVINLFNHFNQAKILQKCAANAGVQAARELLAGIFLVFLSFFVYVKPKKPNWKMREQLTFFALLFDCLLAVRQSRPARRAAWASRSAGTGSAGHRPAAVRPRP